MKITCLFLMIALVQVSASTYSQSARLTFNLKNVKLSEVFDQIEKNSEFRFFYDSGDFDLTQNVTISADDSKIEEILNGVFKNLDISYEIFDRYIIVKTKGRESSFVKNILQQQQKTISGKVTDSSGAPVPGVTVVVSGTSNGTVTGADGEYSIMNIQPEDKLIFSFVGMKTQEIIVGTQSTIDITMVVDAIGIEEVIAIGYGTMKKNDLTGSISTVDESKITQRSVTTIGEGLQGQVAGVQITQPNGHPGASPVIRIRGVNSIQYGNDPLWVVDGFPLSSGWSYINPNEIETITVLKDASATAIYGANGANGVIIVTTKKGKAGKTKISFDTYCGVQNVTNMYDMMNAKEWATAQRTFWERFRNGAYLSRAFPQEEIDQMGEGTNWQEEIFRTGIIQNHNLSISGANEKTNFFVSGNFLNHEGIVINSKFHKGNFSINLEHKANDKFSFGTSIKTAYEHKQGISSLNVVYGALIMAPTSPVKNEDGTYFSQNDQWIERGIMARINRENPVMMAYEQIGNSDNTHIFTNLFGSYQITNGLTAKVSLGGDINYYRVNHYTPSYFYSESASHGSADASASQTFNWVNENTLTYIKTFNDIHSLNIVGGITAQQQKSEILAASATDFYTDITQYYDLSIGAEPGIPSTSYSEWTMVSLLGRVNYNYADRYFVTASARYDGSSRFGSNNRFAFFPSGALAWRVSQEDFLKDTDWLANLKLRLSYGKTGNQAIPLYQNILPYNKITSYPFGSNITTAVGPGSLVNPDLKWEATDQYNAGIDLGIFNNKLSFTADYYYKKTKDLLFNVSVPRQGGYSTVLKNIGSVENKGFEFGVNANLGKGDFSWNGSGNISFNRNKVLELAESDRFFGPNIGWRYISRNGGAATIIMEGEPLGVFWGNIFDGLWQTEEEFQTGHMATNTNVGPGFENYRDIDGNGIFEEGVDETIIGDPHPDFVFDVSNSFNYKHFDLSFNIYGVVGNDIFNANLIELTSQVNVDNALKAYINNWDGVGTSNKYFKNDRPTGRSGVFPNRASTQYIEDGTFVRLQNLTFGYNVPVRVIQKLRVYVSADNLVTLTKYSGFNPEVSSLTSDMAAGIDAGTYPVAKTVRLGVQIDL
ncbi:TonB-dependent receptor [Maribellus comscasis]|nr:TonB-dependent receptor [Maribellus comscasis]